MGLGLGLGLGFGLGVRVRVRVAGARRAVDADLPADGEHEPVGRLGPEAAMQLLHHAHLLRLRLRLRLGEGLG